jgi:predicted DNA-binding transcriptional regulator YafY
MNRGLAKAERLRQLEHLLVIAHAVGGVTVAELADKLKTSQDTIWRDIHELESRVQVQNENGLYWIERTDYLTSVRLNVGESLMLYLAMRRAIRQTSYAPPSMVNALEKMVLALRDPAGEQLAASTRTLQNERAADHDKIQVWETLIRAWVEQITVFIHHQSHKRDDARVYEFQPYLFEPAILSEGVYVVGFSLSHKELRTFKVERIFRVTLTTRSFQRPENLNVDELVRFAWGIWYGKPEHDVCLHFQPRVARRVKETLWHPQQQVSDLPNGGVEWHVQVAGTQELIPWIRGWGPDVEVISPPELRQTIADDVRLAAEIYGEDRK